MEEFRISYLFEESGREISTALEYSLADAKHAHLQTSPSAYRASLDFSGFTFYI